MTLSRPFILRPIATSLLMIALLLVGLVAYKQLPISTLPQVDFPTIQIATFYPGASPDVVGSSITAPLERQFGQLPGLSQMTSSSTFGSSVVTLQFNLDENIDVAEQEVQAAINSAGIYLPSDLPNPPIYNKVNPADPPILTLALSSDSLPLSKVQDLADTSFAQKISQLPAVGLVSLSGGQKAALRIEANPTAMAAYGISLEQLRTVLGQVNIDRAKGQVDGTRQTYTINSNDQLYTADQYRDIVIAYKSGAPVRLSDIRASVRDVQFSMVLTIALVVMVIFLFLRNLAATVIPKRRGATLHCRNVRRDVSAGIFSRQFVIDGTDDLNGLRGR